MPLPRELDVKIRNRFDDLIDEVEPLLRRPNEYDPKQDSIYREWVVKSVGLVQMLFGESKQTERYQKILERDPSLGQTMGSPTWYFTADTVRKKSAILRGIRDNYVNGFYDGLEQLIVANISADYMEQAEALLGEGITGQYDHVPAAVLCGAVLEDALRRLCQKQTPPIATTKNNGQKKTMEPLIQDLQKAQVFNKLVADHLRSWAKIRNYAAHGEFNQFTKEQVDQMIAGVKHFLTMHL